MDFCTLFDSNYIDKALVMYDSLIEVCDEVTLYVIAFDEKCFQTLTDMSLSHMIVISYEDFEDDTIRQCKENRSRREFLWTCSGYSVRYLIKRFDMPVLTYIDSDLFFYSSPKVVLDKFIQSNCDVAITPHNYSNHLENTYIEKVCGKYCVEFNSFKNTTNGLDILDWWVNRCIESCPENPSNGLFGDQKYLDQFETRFDGIYVYEDFGIGIAPWNVDDYTNPTIDIKNTTINTISNRRTRKSGSLVFYHFHSLDVFSDGTSNIRVFIRPGRHDKEFIYILYKPYIQRIIEKRKLLKDYLDRSDNTTARKLGEGELISFLTSEPNLLFLIRKIWRYILYKRYDYISV